jgi:hypothetical protein
MTERCVITGGVCNCDNDPDGCPLTPQDYEFEFSDDSVIEELLYDNHPWHET